MIEDVLPQLSCPNCATAMHRREHSLVCEEGHAFDVARQGYVSLFGGDPHGKTADTAQMVAARVRFLGEGHYAGIAGLVTRLAAQVPAIDGTCVVDLGAGTGYYLASVLGAVDAPGIALDISKPAARYAAHAHPRVGAVVADIWQPLPIRGRAASVLLDIFSPRNTHEMRRVLHPEGRAIVVVPEPDHLRELVEEHGLLQVDGRKAERLEAQFADRFAVEAEHTHRETLHLTVEQAATLIDMGPNAWHAQTRAAASGTPGSESGTEFGTESGPAAPLDSQDTKQQVTLSVRAYVLSRR